MTHQATLLPKPSLELDYSLTGVNASVAIEKGLAEAEWYQCFVPRETMRLLLERRDGPAIRNTLLWFGLIFACGFATVSLWGSWWAALSYAIYAVLYASGSDSRWHEAGHGTAFRSDWMNNVLYEIASFMIMRESVVWRWSHTRHHSDTIIVGRDPEIAVPRPPNLWKIVMSFFNLPVYLHYFWNVLAHALGHMSAAEKTYIPATEFSKIHLRARVYVSIYLAVIALALVERSVLPLLLVGLTNLFGTWLTVSYGMTQHAGLAENVLDHRLNCRTVYMNSIHRFMYMNMNYHIEHHMYPLVPFHALPRLHELIKEDCPPAYPSLLGAWREIAPTVMRQVKDPAYHINRQLPQSRGRTGDAPVLAPAKADEQGWVDVCPSADLKRADVLRFDYGKKTFAVYRDEESRLYATDGICTHGNVHLSTGLVKGTIIECSKHNGRFNLIDGSPARAPICRGLATYPVEERYGERGSRLAINVERPDGAGARATKTCRFQVIGNRSVATFIKELTVAPLDGQQFDFTPGDYLQIDIPAYEQICFRDFDIPQPFATVWDNQHVFDLVARNSEPGRRNNYSLASNRQTEATLRFNVRIATPPPGQDCAPGVGSSYIFSLRPGDIITAIGPFGDFHIKPTQREMVYIGGGAGMAPLRAHLSHLLESDRTARRVSFWYGARSRQEIFYEDYFRRLASEHRNFSFHLALSAPQPEDNWSGLSGFIHEVVLEHHLASHPNPLVVEYYLCGPPMMIKACVKMLTAIGVPGNQIAYDEF